MKQSVICLTTAMCCFGVNAFSPSEDNCISDTSSLVLLTQEQLSLCQSSESVTDNDDLLVELTPAAQTVPSYWEHWQADRDNPLLSQNLATSHFGVGVWLPQEYAEMEDQMTTEEWIRKHGLQLSVGFGEQSDDAPRMRFDYRWHQTSEADIMMQVELPF